MFTWVMQDHRRMESIVLEMDPPTKVVAGRSMDGSGEPNVASSFLKMLKKDVWGIESFWLEIYVYCSILAFIQSHNLGARD